MNQRDREEAAVQLGLMRLARQLLPDSFSTAVDLHVDALERFTRFLTRR